MKLQNEIINNALNRELLDAAISKHDDENNNETNDSEINHNELMEINQ